MIKFIIICFILGLCNSFIKLGRFSTKQDAVNHLKKQIDLIEEHYEDLPYDEETNAKLWNVARYIVMFFLSIFMAFSIYVLAFVA